MGGGPFAAEGRYGRSGVEPADRSDRAVCGRTGKKLALVIEPAARSLHEQAEKLGESLRGPITHFASGVERLPAALASFREGADAIGRVGNDLEAIGSASESLSRSSTSLSRIELLLAKWPSTDPRLEEIQRGIERTGTAIESLAGSWSAAYERSSRATQEQLAHSLTNLKDALEMLNVSMEQGNALYRSIVKKLFDERSEGDRIEAIPPFAWRDSIR